MTSTREYVRERSSGAQPLAVARAPHDQGLHRSDDAAQTNVRQSLGLVRVGVLVLVLAAVLIGVVGLTHSLVFFDKRADGYSSLAYLDLIYGHGYRVLGNEPRSLFRDRAVVEAASAVMPMNAEYRVVVGRDWQPGWTTRWSKTLEADFLRFFLLPRRQTTSARWVFCFDCDLGSTVDFEILARGRDGLSFGRVVR
jgi:hypothetical protein